MGMQITLTVNGETKQSSTLAEMIWDPAEIVGKAGELWALKPGDLIFTGTPEGVGAVVRGDVLEGGVDGLGTLRLQVG